MPKIVENPLVRARVDPRRKRNAEVILFKSGISPGQAINMLDAQIEMKKAFPSPSSHWKTAPCWHLFGEAQLVGSGGFVGLQALLAAPDGSPAGGDN